MNLARNLNLAKLIGAVLSINLCSCFSVATPNIQSEELNFQKDLEITESFTEDWANEGYTQVGVGVLEKKKYYRFLIESRRNPSIIRISNCHRDEIFYDQKKKFYYDFKPNPVIENGKCLMQITVLDSKGRHQFGALAFKDGERLPAIVQCNGETDNEVGSSFCQAKSNTYQALTFGVPVKVVPSDGCEAKSKDSLKEWVVKAKSGYCQFRFVSRTGSAHKLVTFGYDELIKR